MASNGIMFVPNFMKTGQLVQKVKGGGTWTDTHTRSGRWCHLLFFLM